MIKHRYFDELIDLEKNKLFCGEKLKAKNKFLIIGTFNPDENSCLKTNKAEWYYGRKKNNLWRYLPRALGFNSLHLSDMPNVTVNDWKKFSLDNRIIFIDLIKSIDTIDQLPDFGDNEVEARISDDLKNVNAFDVVSAFSEVSFEKVIYSLSWSDTKIKKLKKVRDEVNKMLVSSGSVQSLDQIKYPNSPARNDSYPQWLNAIND